MVFLEAVQVQFPPGSGPSMHPSELVGEMRNSGFALKRNVPGRNLTTDARASEAEEDPEVEFLNKNKFLRKFDRLEKKNKKKKSYTRAKVNTKSINTDPPPPPQRLQKAAVSVSVNTKERK